VKVKLVLSGSGTKFPIFAGALKRLEEAGYIIEEIIGTSGGAIIAAALASGMSADKIINLCKEIMPRLHKLVDFNVFRPLTDWGFVGGKKIKEELGKHFVNILGEVKIPLHITVTNFDTGMLEIFSSKTHPKLETNRAVRASASIPVFFVPEIINGDMYIDGGVKANFAIDYFKDTSNIIGLYFVEKPGRKPRPKGILAFVNFIGRIIDMLINAKTQDDIEDAPNAIRIPLTSEVNGLDFSFKPEEVEAMIKEGYNGVDRWIKTNSR
jgi:NTE family protein